MTVTGWDNGLSQDYNKKLAQWFMSKPGAMHELRSQFMTTRTELIARHQYIADHDVNFETREIARATADMLEADAVNDDLTIAYMSGFKAGEDKYKAALRLALDALIPFGTPNWAGSGVDEANAAIAALKEVL